MDPFLVLLHSVSASLSSSELTELKFLCQGRVGKRKLERVQSGVDLFSVLLEQNELSPEHTALLRELLVSLRRQDLLRRLDAFEAGAAGGAAPEERGGGGGRGSRGAGGAGGARWGRGTGWGDGQGGAREAGGPRGGGGPPVVSLFPAPNLFRIRFAFPGCVFSEHS